MIIIANEIQRATEIGKTPIESVTNISKIASQLQSKSDLLGIEVKGNMENMTNPEVQKGLSTLNEITSSTESRIWKGTWISKDPIQVYEYIKNGIGVVRSQVDGSLISVVSRTGDDLEKLDRLIQQGKGSWIR